MTGAYQPSFPRTDLENGSLKLRRAEGALISCSDRFNSGLPTSVFLNHCYIRFLLYVPETNHLIGRGKGIEDFKRLCHLIYVLKDDRNSTDREGEEKAIRDTVP